MMRRPIDPFRPPTPPRLDARRLFAVALIAGLGVSFASAGASCRAVVAGNGTDAVSELCTLLKRCYGDDAVHCQAIESYFGAAQPDDKFLTFMSQNDCLKSCGNAKKCWDFAPVCRGEAASCSTFDKCCGFTSGRALCEKTACTDPGCDRQRCCTPKSVPCDARTDVCCGGLACVPAPDGVSTCGGVKACIDVGASCEFNVDCCSKQCTNKECVQKTCGSLGEGCDGAPGSCCDLPGQAVACVAGTCQVPKCDIEPCGAPLVCDPTGDSATACCNDPRLQCVVDVAGTYGICVHKDQSTNKDLLPDGFDCSSDTDCCSGGCIDQGVKQCGPPPTCALVGGACMAGGDCCSGQCVSSACTCGGTTCHLSTIEGPPMACETTDPNFVCVSLVCQLDGFCCCSGWDALCVTEAAAIPKCQ